MQIDHSDLIYDIAVIGGGIAGAGIARDASLRGLKVVLFEKNSFGSGTSSKSSKLIHGGIRYLELSWNALKKAEFGEAWKNLSFVFLSLKESRVLKKIAPDLVQPLPLLIPIYKSAPRGRLSIFFGATLYFFLGLLSGGVRFPKVFWRRKSVLRQLPELQPEYLRGGILIWDHLTNDLELVKATMDSAARHGAQCMEKAEVIAYEHDQLRNLYVISIWMMDGDTHRFFAKKLINASGPWIDKLRAAHGDKDRFLIPVAGSHIELPKFINHSVILQARDKRVFFVINIGNRSRVGTTEWDCPDPDSVLVPKSDVEYFLNSLSRYFPSHSFKKEEIISADAGIRPLSASSTSSNLNTLSRDHEIRVDSERVLHVIGVKLTDYRRAAEHAVDILLPDLFRSGIQKKSLTAITPLIN